MSTYADDIRRIARSVPDKNGLNDTDEKLSVGGSTKATGDIDSDEPDVETGTTGGMKTPLTLDILTYDDTQDLIFTDTSSANHTFKTAATAQITDDNGIVWAIDTITYAAP